MLRRTLTLATLAWLAHPAVADPQTAKHAADEAEHLAQQRAFAPAASKFRDAFASDPLPEYLCNAGVAYVKGEDWPRALRYLQQCVDVGATLDQAFVANARKVLASVQRKLNAGAFTPVDFVIQPSTASIAIDGGMPFDEPLVGSGRAWFPRGTYNITISAPGYVAQHEAIAATSKTAIAIRAALERAPEPEPPKLTSTPTPTPSPLVRTPTPPIESRPSLAPPIAFTIGTGLAGAVAGGALVYALGKRDDAEGTADMSVFDANADKFRTGRKVFWIASGVTAASAVVTGYLWYRALHRRAPVDVGVVPDTSSSGGAFVVGGQF